MTKLKPTIYISVLIAVLTACTFEGNRKDNEVQGSVIEQVDKENKEDKVKRIQRIFYTLPSPVEITMLFKKEGVRYHRDILHNTAVRSNYESSTSKAFNLGIYGADLSFSGLHGKHGETIQYFAASQLLASDLGIGEAFQQGFILRLEQNAGNKDTLLKVVSDFFIQNDKGLYQSDQQDFSTYILVAGWIEGVFLGTNIADGGVDAKGVRNIISNQRDPLHNIIELLQSTTGNDSADELLGMLIELEAIYDNVEGELKVEQFNNIKRQVEQLRNYIINLN